MAQHMRTILQDTLYVDPVDDDAAHMPSPEFFKGKILVKGKRLPQDKTEEDDVDDDDEEDEELQDVPDGNEKHKKKTKVRGSNSVLRQ